MIVDLSANDIGNTIEFSYRTPLRGLVQITTFNDSITNSNATRFFTKKFRFALDGVRYSPWYDLTVSELQNRIHVAGSIPIKNDLIIQFQYIRSGADPSGSLTINSATVGGLWTFEYLQLLDFEGTIFEDIAFTDEYWNEVWLNLMNKLYESGIVAEYVERKDNSSNQDEDYITFFKVLAYYFSLIIALVDKKITHLIDDEILLSDYLLQRKLFLCKDQTIEQFQWMAQNTYDIVRERGTKSVVRIDGDHLTNIVLNPNHGELLRMICFDILKDEFLFEYIRGGLYIDETWPTFFGLSNHLQLNKAPEQTQDFNDLSLFDIVGSVGLTTDGSKEIAQISAISSIRTKSIKIDDSVSYQVSFFVRQTSIAPNFSVFATLSDENEFPIATLNASTGAVVTDGRFINAFQFASTSNYYWFTATILAQNANLLATPIITSISAGTHLKMSAGARRLKIRIANVGINYLNIWDLKITPLQNVMTSEFINGPDVTNVWLKNNNFNHSDTDVRNNIERYLIPQGALVNTIIL